jgi:hypothetical protein
MWNGSTASPLFLQPEKEPPVPTGWRPCKPQNHYRRCNEERTISIEPRFFSYPTIAFRYTDSADFCMQRITNGTDSTLSCL